MSRVILPTREEIIALAEMRADACVSIYLQTSPLPQNRDAGRIELKNMVKEALAAAENIGCDKHILEALKERLDDVTEADDFWFFQANSLAVLATPDCIRTYRLPNKLDTQLEVSDRFYLKPLMRALTFAHRGYILALSENEARVVELFPDAPAEVITLADMPSDALSAIGRSSVTATSGSLTRESGSRGPKMRLAQYARQVDEALRPLLLSGDAPLILIATESLAFIFRSVSSVLLADDTIFISPDRLSLTELTTLARPVLEKYHAGQLEEIKKLFAQRADQHRVVTDIADVAKAASYGMVSMMLVDFTSSVTGLIDDNGVVVFTEEPGAYGVIDELVKRSLACGAKVMALRSEEMPGNSSVAAIVRYTL